MMNLNTLTELWAQDASRAGVYLGIAVIVAGAVHLLAGPMVRRLAARTSNQLDDVVAGALPFPLAVSVLLVGIRYALQPMHWAEHTYILIEAVGTTVGVILWTRALSQVSHAILELLSTQQGRISLFQPRTLPLFDILARTLIYGGAAYVLLLAWNIDVTAWLASAGVVGIAVGFASKDTLSNLFAGLSIIADSPYKIGDYLIIDDTTRGRVTQIGLRSTRLLTRDDVEVIVPNSVMAGARITNESGGPFEHERIRCPVDVAYDSDLDRVREVLMRVTAESSFLLHQDPSQSPRVRFRAFGDSGIRVEVLGWIERPELRGAAMDDLVVRIWRAFKEEGIEIPFPQRVVHLMDDP